MSLFAGLTNSVPGLVGGALSYFGAKSANRLQMKLAREQMAFQRESAGQQMAFQERMSNTAYQRAMADMAAAGLNPILAFNQGGASTPGGASASGAMANIDNALEKGVSSALQAMSVRANIDQTKATTALLKAELPEKKAAAGIYDTKAGKILKWIEEIKQSLNPLSLFRSGK